MFARRHLLLVPYALCLSAAAYLLIITPTLNLDDLQIAEWGPQALSEGWGKALTTLLFNLDFGVWQPRTYGLARAIHYIQAWLFGAAPAPVYALILAAHFGSGVLVYKIIRKIGSDRLTAIFAAMTWIASPAVLPLLKVQHHFLYLIATYYPLFAWLLLSADRRQTPWVFLLGTILLTMAWMLGEGVAIPMFAAVATAALLAGSWQRGLSLFAQGAIAGLLFVLYLGYQVVFLRSSDATQRFKLAPDLGRIDIFLHQLGQNVRAVLGLSHFDAELGMAIGGIGVLRNPGLWVLALVLTGFGIAAMRHWPQTDFPANRRLAATFALLSFSSIGICLAFVLAGMGVFSVRYAAAFFALMPVAVIALLDAYATKAVARPAAAAIAALSVALLLSLLYRAEVLVNAPNRIRLQALQGSVVLLRPQDQFDPAKYGAIPGLTSINANGLANPMRSLWTADPALRYYAGAVIGNRCRMVSADRAEVFLLETSKGIYPLKNFVVEGSSLTASQACNAK